jgi:hypothetical protein
MMTVHKTILALTLVASSIFATQAHAFFASYDAEVSGDRPPPNGLNGTSMTGVTDNGLASLRFNKDQAAADAVKSVVLPDGSVIVVK